MNTNYLRDSFTKIAAAVEPSFDPKYKDPSRNWSYNTLYTSFIRPGVLAAALDEDYKRYFTEALYFIDTLLAQNEREINAKYLEISYVIYMAILRKKMILQLLGTGELTTEEFQRCTEAIRTYVSTKKDDAPSVFTYRDWSTDNMEELKADWDEYLQKHDLAKVNGEVKFYYDLSQLMSNRKSHTLEDFINRVVDFAKKNTFEYRIRMIDYLLLAYVGQQYFTAPGQVEMIRVLKQMLKE